MSFGTKRQKLSLSISVFAASICLSLASFGSDIIPVYGGKGPVQSPINEDLSRLMTYRLTSNRVFRVNPWDIAFNNPSSIVAFIKKNIAYVFQGAGVAICYNERPADKSADLVVKGARVSVCSSAELSQASYKDHDTYGEPDGFIDVLRAKGSLEARGFDGGYVLNPYQYVPFGAVDAGVFWLNPKKGSIPTGLESEMAQTLYRVAQYSGDSLLSGKSGLSYCSGVLPSDEYVCDQDTNGPFALKGVSLLSFASSCADCSSKERAFLAGYGLNYLLSTPFGSDLSDLAFSIYAQNKADLEDAGFDVSMLERKKIFRMLKK